MRQTMQTDTRAPIAVLRNAEGEVFNWKLDINQYGKYSAEELEVHLYTDYVELTGAQQWKPAVGGWGRQCFMQRYLLPYALDANRLTAYLLPTGEVQVQAPGVDMLTQLQQGTNSQTIKPRVFKVLPASNTTNTEYAKQVNTALQQVLRKLLNKPQQERKGSGANLLEQLFNKSVGEKQSTAQVAKNRLLSGSQSLDVQKLMQSAAKPSQIQLQMLIDQLGIQSKQPCEPSEASEVPSTKFNLPETFEKASMGRQETEPRNQDLAKDEVVDGFAKPMLIKSSMKMPLDKSDDRTKKQVRISVDSN